MSTRQTSGPIVWNSRQNSLDVRAPSVIWPSERRSSTSVRRLWVSSSATTTRSVRGGAFVAKDASVCGISLMAGQLYPASRDLYNAQSLFVDAYRDSHYSSADDVALAC